MHGETIKVKAEKTKQNKVNKRKTEDKIKTESQNILEKKMERKATLWVIVLHDSLGNKQV